MVALDDVDKANGAFGHTLCAEKPYGPTNNALMLTRQIAITQKVPPPTLGHPYVGFSRGLRRMRRRQVGKGTSVPTALYAEKGTSKLKASFSGGPCLNKTASEWADTRHRLA